MATDASFPWSDWPQYCEMLKEIDECWALEVRCLLFTCDRLRRDAEELMRGARRDMVEVRIVTQQCEVLRAKARVACDELMNLNQAEGKHTRPVLVSRKMNSPSASGRFRATLDAWHKCIVLLGTCLQSEITLNFEHDLSQLKHESSKQAESLSELRLSVNSLPGSDTSPADPTSLPTYSSESEQPLKTGYEPSDGQGKLTKDVAPSNANFLDKSATSPTHLKDSTPTLTLEPPPPEKLEICIFVAGDELAQRLRGELDTSSHIDIINLSFAKQLDLMEAAESIKPQNYTGPRGHLVQPHHQVKIKWRPLGAVMSQTSSFFISELQDEAVDIVLGRNSVDLQGMFGDFDTPTPIYHLEWVRKSRKRKNAERQEAERHRRAQFAREQAQRETEEEERRRQFEEDTVQIRSQLIQSSIKEDD